MFPPDTPLRTTEDAAAEAQAALDAVLARKPTSKTLLDKWRLLMAAIADPDLSANAKAMLLVILDEYQGARGYARRGYRYLAAKAGMTERTARRAVHDLVEAGYLLKRVDRRGSASEVNQYKPVWSKDVRPDLAAPPDDDVWPDLATRGGISGHKGGAPVATNIPLGDISPDSDGSIEPSGNSSVSAAAQARGPAFPSGTERPKAKRQPVELITLPEGCPFDSEDIAARIAKDLTSDDIAVAEASFREKTAGEHRSLAEWKRTAKAWLKIQKPVSVQAHTTGTLLPCDFTADFDMVQKAMALGLTRDEVQEAFRGFAEHYRSVSGPKALSRDWNASWMLWMRGAAEKKKRGNGGKPTNAIGCKQAI